MRQVRSPSSGPEFYELPFSKNKSANLGGSSSATFLQKPGPTAVRGIEGGPIAFVQCHDLGDSGRSSSPRLTGEQQAAND